MKNMRHIVNVMRPTKARGTVGEVQGQDETIVKDWPCSIDTLSGRELELARSTFAAASHRVEGYGDPSKPIKATDYLQFGARRLHIGLVSDELQNGVKLSLVCGEEV